jgi:hypothetical protein
MSKTFLIAVLTGTAIAAATAPASACQHPCGYRAPAVEPEVVYYKHEIEPLKRPPHYVVEWGPLYDGLAAVSAPRVFEPRRKSKHFPGVYGYGVGYSGGPVAKNYPYVSHVHRRQPALRVYY